MKQTIQILQEFGEFLSEVRTRLDIKVDLLTADIQGSHRVYSKV